VEVYAIINPVSGSRKPAEVLRCLRARLAREGVRLICRVSAGPGDAARLARNVPQHARAILVVGGDGTVREVVEGRDGPDPPIVILPTGTENLVAKAFGMSPDPNDTAERILRGKPQGVDVGLAGGRRFLLVSGIGFDAEVVDRLHRTRRGHITHLDYSWPVWRTFWAHAFPPVHVEVDGRPFFEGRGLVFVGLLNRYALGLRILPMAKHDDGLMDVCVCPCSSRTRLLGHSVRTLLRRHVGRGGVLYAQCRTAIIQGDRTVAVQVDGDYAGTLPVSYRMAPSTASFLSSDRGAS
jgi:diacylglycerol kinase family enzyme